MHQNSFKQTLCIVILLLLLIGCATVPITGRSQINMISDEVLVALANESFSQFMALVSNRGMVLSPSETPEATEILTTVNHVSQRIIDASDLRGHLNWETVVVKSKEINAFVMPNGKIIVFTGLLPVAKSEAGLAAVISHEIAHVVAHHQAERVSQIVEFPEFFFSKTLNLLK
jgi:predicted Zn-dependent protease